MLTKALHPHCRLVPEIETLRTVNWIPVCNVTYNRDAWVKLLDLPAQDPEEEALLLCQESDTTWVVWVPSLGEMRLDKSNFFC